jgi:hypothetical protein
LFITVYPFYFGIILPVLLRFTASDYPFDLQLLITPLIYSFWLPLWFTASDYPIDLQLLITPLIYGFWLPHWFTASDYPFDLQLLITPLIYSFWLPLWFTASDYPFDLQLLIIPLIYSFWLPLWFTASDYPPLWHLQTLHFILRWLCDDAFLYDEYQLRVHVDRHFPLLWNVTVAVCCIRMISTIKSLLTWSAFVFNFNQHTYDTLLQILQFHIWLIARNDGYFAH